uniref:hypothetical protein n=1 Tax=uncultured Caulobacter sp. TaxID=158749 RepID=UPI0025D0E398|nr:hypothetical protein [uncultured Caulobacter sp.]
MRFTSRKDMIAAALVVGAGLMFQMGAIFGPDPPAGFLEANAARASARARPPPPSVGSAPPGVTVADFLERPAAIRAVTIDGRDGRARLDLRLGPGAINPRFSRGGEGALVIRGLDAGGGFAGSAQGLVARWTVEASDGKASATFAVRRPFIVARVWLDDTHGDDRHLLIDLVEACGPDAIPRPTHGRWTAGVRSPALL